MYILRIWKRTSFGHIVLNLHFNVLIQQVSVSHCFRCGTGLIVIFLKRSFRFEKIHLSEDEICAKNLDISHENVSIDKKKGVL